MRPLSASECITPAIDRTKLILFAPFRKGRTWKLSATAYLCRIGTMFFPFPLIYLAFLPAVRSAGAPAVIGLCAAVLIGTGIFVYLFHLCSRLQFAYFDIVVNRGEFVAPAWRKYGPQSRSWTGIKLLLGTAVALACAVPIAAYIRHIIPLLHSMETIPPGQPPPPEFMAAIFAGYGIILLVFGPFYLISSLLADFIVPSLALEDTGIAEAFRRMFALIRQEPGEFALYTLLKISIGFAMYMGAIIAWEIVFILITVILEVIFGIIGFILHIIGVPTVILIILNIFIGIIWFVFITGYTMMLTIGPIFTFLDAYTLYFLGGRYPMLGDLLDRSTPPPSYAYAAGYPPSPLPYQPPQPEPPQAG
jgi:hypothetical protein